MNGQSNACPFVYRSNSRCIDGRRSGVSAAKEIGLWVVPVFQARAATRIRLARKQKTLETIRSPERICLLQDFYNSGRLQFERTMAMRVIFRDDQTEVAAGTRQRNSLCQLLD